tara:strand:- start:614 stop:871 length:258 start_codon:yes stop_codon:yes gene_type:complete
MKEKIVVYTTKRCPYCDASKTLLQRKSYPYSEVDVSDPDLRMMLVKKAQGRKTVPQIFIGDLHVGGFDELQTMDKNGELEALIKA